MSKKEKRQKGFFSFIFAPFSILGVEKFYLVWFCGFIISFSTIIIDCFNGQIENSFSQGIFYSTSMAILAPLFFDFLIEYTSINRRSKKEYFSSYKAWTMALIALALILLFFFYLTNLRSSSVLQIISTAVVIFLAFYTFLVSKMNNHTIILNDFKDKSYDKSEKEKVEAIKSKSKAITCVENPNGGELKL